MFDRPDGTHYVPPVTSEKWKKIAMSVGGTGNVRSGSAPSKMMGLLLMHAVMFSD